MPRPRRVLLWLGCWLGCADALTRPPLLHSLRAPPAALAAARASPLRAVARVAAARRRRPPSMKGGGMVDEASDAAVVDDGDEMAGAVRGMLLAVAASIAFGGGVWTFRGAEDGSAWFAAYILEESLSIDNLFVFSLIFSYFQTPPASQPKVLRYGLLAAIALRGVFIVGGLAVVE
ncbi:hypothetical protein EMIHUDRAFT_124646, partial [Emiliania huxleyi CCMP1516]|uniref:Uncharacterized protein n=2 Tax=Emiliania huxleyi TaxID=2903 RepID=A0A0D3IKA1_EMIH1